MPLLMLLGQDDELTAEGLAMAPQAEAAALAKPEEDMDIIYTDGS